MKKVYAFRIHKATPLKGYLSIVLVRNKGSAVIGEVLVMAMVKSEGFERRSRTVLQF